MIANSLSFYDARMQALPGNPQDDPTPDDLPPSKSQIKRDMHALLALGQRLVDLPQSRLDALPLEDALRDAIALARRIHAREGRRRQVHYVGKLLRKADLSQVRQMLDQWERGESQHTEALHQLEALRARLLADDHAVTELLAEHPGLDVTALRNTIRAARKEALANAALPEGHTPARKHSRALFQWLKTLYNKDDTSDA